MLFLFIIIIIIINTFLIRGIKFIHRHAASLHSHSCENRYHPCQLPRRSSLKARRTRRGQEKTCQTRGGWVFGGLPRGDRPNIHKFCANFTTVYLSLKHRDDIGQRIPFFPLTPSKQTEEVISWSGDDVTWFLLGIKNLSDHYPSPPPRRL